MKKYIEVTRSDTQGSYIAEVEDVHSMIDGELDDIQNITPGTTITLKVIEMDEDEYASREEFTGW